MNGTNDIMGLRSKTKRRKPGTNLTLSRQALVCGEELRKAANRPSLTNLVEHLIILAHRQAFAPPVVPVQAVTGPASMPGRLVAG